MRYAVGRLKSTKRFPLAPQSVMYVLGCYGLYKNPFLTGDHQAVETDWAIDLFRK